jgi:hypothetical protein
VAAENGGGGADGGGGDNVVDLCALAARGTVAGAGAAVAAAAMEAATTSAEWESGLARRERVAIGLACKAAIDAGRCAFARDALGLRAARLARYVASEVSPENVMLLAVAAPSVMSCG